MLLNIVDEIAKDVIVFADIVVEHLKLLIFCYCCALLSLASLFLLVLCHPRLSLSLSLCLPPPSLFHAFVWVCVGGGG